MGDGFVTTCQVIQYQANQYQVIQYNVMRVVPQVLKIYFIWKNLTKSVSK